MSLGTDLETFTPEPTKPDPPPGYTIFQRAVSVDQMSTTPSDYSPTTNSDVDIYEIPTSSNPRPFPRRSTGSLHDCVIAEQPYETMTNGSSSRPGSVYGSPNSNAEQQYETMTSSTSSRPGSSVYGSPYLNGDEQQYETMTHGSVHSTTSQQQYETMTNGDNGFVFDGPRPVAKQHYETMANGVQLSSSPKSLCDTPQSAAKQHNETMANGDQSSSRPGSLYDTPRSAKQHYEMMTNDQSSSRPGSLYDTPRSAVKQHYETMTNGDQSSSRPGSLYDTPRSAVKQHYETMTNGDQVNTPPISQPTYDVPRPSSITNGKGNHVGHQFYEVPAHHGRLSTSSSQPSPSPPQTSNSDYTNVAPDNHSPSNCGRERKFSREHTYYENVKLPRRSSGSPPNKHQRTVITPQDHNCSVSSLNGDYIPVSVDPVIHPQYEQAGGHLNGKQHGGYEWSNGDFRNTSD